MNLDQFKKCIGALCVLIVSCLLPRGPNQYLDCVLMSSLLFFIACHTSMDPKILIAYFGLFMNLKYLELNYCTLL